MLGLGLVPRRDGGTANRQERAARRQKRADKQAEIIIKTAAAEIQAQPKEERVEGCTDEEFELGSKVRNLRLEGEPWWAIARALDLPGSGDSAVTGKKGAARARLAYAKAFGSFPRTFKKHGSKTPVEKNEHVREMAKTKKAERMAAAKAGKSVIPEDMPDEEVARMLKGRKIKWYTVSTITPEGMDHEANVHPKADLFIIGEGLDRIVEFREFHKQAPIDYRWMPAHSRSVKLSTIYSVS